MDFLNPVSRLANQLDVEVPKKDYPDLVDGLDALVNYFKRRTE